jgi:hypothetical protein
VDKASTDGTWNGGEIQTKKWSLYMSKRCVRARRQARTQTNIQWVGDTNTIP